MADCISKLEEGFSSRITTVLRAYGVKGIEIMDVKALWKWKGIITITLSNMNPSRALILLSFRKIGKVE